MRRKPFPTTIKGNRIKKTKKFIKKVKNFTPAQLDAVEIVSEYLQSLLSSFHVCDFNHYDQTCEVISHLMEELENDTYLYELIDWMEEELRVSFEYYTFKLEQKYPEFLGQRDIATFTYDVGAAEKKMRLDNELAMKKWKKWKKENPYNDVPDIPLL